MEMSHDNDRQRKGFPSMEMSRFNDQKNASISNEKKLQNHSLIYNHKSNFQLPAFHLVRPWLTTLLLPWTS